MAGLNFAQSLVLVLSFGFESHNVRFVRKVVSLCYQPGEETPECSKFWKVPERHTMDWSKLCELN